MKILNVTSHKGGVGKTTVSLGLASILAADHNSKVCFIEADIYGAGLTSAFKMEPPNLFLNHFLTIETLKEAKDKSLQCFLTSLPISSKSGFQELKVVLSSINTELKQETISNVQSWDVVITYEMLSLMIDKIGEDGYDYLIIDNSPGISTLQLAFQYLTFQNNGMNIFVSTHDRPSIMGLLIDMGASSAELEEWDLSECALIINRTLPEQRKFYNKKENFINYMNNDFNQQGSMPAFLNINPRLMSKWVNIMAYHNIEYDPLLDMEQFAFGSKGQVPIRSYRRSNLENISKWIIERFESR